MAYTPFTLQPASPGDQAPIKNLVRASGINPFGLHWSRFIVAVDQNSHLIGCGQVKRHRDGTRELASIAVRTDWRSQGIARDIINELQQLHGRPLWLTCISPLVSFYEPLGFVVIEDRQQMPRYFRHAERLFNLYLWIRRANFRLAVMAWH